MSGNRRELTSQKNDHPPEPVLQKTLMFTSLLENFIKTNPLTSHLSEEKKQAAYNSIVQDLIKGGVVPIWSLDFEVGMKRARYLENLKHIIKRKVEVVDGDGVVFAVDGGVYKLE